MAQSWNNHTIITNKSLCVTLAPIRAHVSQCGVDKRTIFVHPYFWQLKWLALQAMVDHATRMPTECTPYINTFGLRICETRTAGRSVFASQPIESNTIIEISPVLLFNPEEYEAYGRHTILDSYTFVWERNTSGNTMALALGPVSYTHLTLPTTPYV